MPSKNLDLHGSAPQSSPLVLVLIDTINDMEFPEGDQLLKAARPAARRIAALAARCRKAGVPVVYCNDNFGRWRSDFQAQVKHCLEQAVRGREVAALLVPQEGDYFVLKPKHSAFFSTVLDTLLSYLGAKKLILCGFAGNICVLFSANDAYMRDYEVCVPRDCIASNTAAENRAALEVMRKILKADTRVSRRVVVTRAKRRA